MTHGQHEQRRVQHYPQHFHPHQNRRSKYHRTGADGIDYIDYILLINDLNDEENQDLLYSGASETSAAVPTWIAHEAGYFSLGEVVKAVTPIGAMSNMLKLAKYLIGHPSEIQPTVAAVRAVAAAASGAPDPTVIKAIPQLMKVAKASGMTSIIDAFIKKHAPEALAAHTAASSSAERSAANPNPKPAPKDNTMLYWGIGIGSFVLILIIVVIILVVRSGKKKEEKK